MSGCVGSDVCAHLSVIIEVCGWVRVTECCVIVCECGCVGKDAGIEVLVFICRGGGV